MSKSTIVPAGLMGMALMLGLSIPAPAPAQTGGRVFELRTYTAAEGKLDAVLARFRDHTVKLFEKHGITNIGYWVPKDEPLPQHTDLHCGSPEPRGSQEILGCFPRRPGMDPREEGVGGRRPTGHQGGIRVPGSDRFLPDEIGSCGPPGVE